MNTVKVRFLLFFLLLLAVGQTSWAQEELKKTEQNKQAKTKPKPAPKAPMNTNNPWANVYQSRGKAPMGAQWGYSPRRNRP